MKIRDAFGRDWPEEHVYQCVGKGWTPILQRLIHDLEALGWDGELHQVKEKFGGLRFYTGGAPTAIADQFFALIDQAEEESLRTCEECGAPGKLRGHGWVYTSCDACADPRERPTADPNGSAGSGESE